MNLTWIDLCSGLGGFSQPAYDRGWRVITVDINPAFKPNIVADLEDVKQLVKLCRYLPQHPTVVSASPVCTDFTKAGLPQTWASNRKCAPKPDAKLTAGCYLLIKTLNPEWWTIENVWRMPPSPDRAAIRAKIPYEIGEAICIAAESKIEIGRPTT